MYEFEKDVKIFVPKQLKESAEVCEIAQYYKKEDVRYVNMKAKFSTLFTFLSGQTFENQEEFAKKRTSSTTEIVDIIAALFPKLVSVVKIVEMLT